MGDTISTPLTISRLFLKMAPEREKQKQLDGIVERIVSEVQRSAIRGETSYMFSGDMRIHTGGNQTAFTNDEVVYALQQNFPDCNVSYEENWVDAKDKRGNVIPTHKVLEKGIIIDWS